MTDRQRGQAIVFFALLLPVVLLPAAAYGAEAPLIAARQARLEEVAVLAALDAAQQLDVAGFRAGGGLAVDASAARSTFLADLAAIDPAAMPGSLTVSANAVSVTVSERVPLRLATFVPGAAVLLHASATASLTPGLAAPS